MTATCKNCHDQFEGHYCNNCGQAAKTGRLSAHSVWHEIEHALIHLDKGVLYTAKQLFTRPGHAIREYIEGRRVKHFKPLSLVIVLTTIQALLYHYFKIDIIPQQGYPAHKDVSDGVTLLQVNEWLTNHFSLTTLIFMFFSSTASFIVFRKRGYNFVEYLFIHAFITSQHLIVQLLLFPITYALNGTPGYTVFTSLLSLVNLGLSIWVLIQLFNTQPRIKIFFLSLLSYLVSIILLVVSAVITANVLQFIFKH